MADTTEAQADHVIFHRSADTGRLFLETASSQVVREKESVAFRASAGIVGLFASAKCDAPTVISQTIDLTESEKGMNGKISFAVSAIYKGDTRLVSVPVVVKEGKSEMPESTVIEALLNSAAGMQKTAALALRNEVDAFIANRTTEVKSEGMAKVASAGPTASTSHFAAVIQVDKPWMPADI